MNFLLHTARKDLSRLRREPGALAAWVGIPVVLTLLMVLIFGGQEAKPHGILLIADEDQSLLSRALPMAFTQDQLGDMFSVEQVTQSVGRARLSEGRASALLVIPKGFSSAVLNGTPCRLTVLKNPAQQILPAIAEQTVQLLAEAGFYLRALAAPQLNSLSSGRPSDAAIAALSVSFTHAGENAARFLFPPRIALDTRVLDPRPQTAPLRFDTLLFPGMLIMALLFTASGLSADWWREQQLATLRRLLSTPNTLAAVLAGKLLAFTAFAALVAAVALALGHSFLSVPLPHPLWTLSWTLLTAIAAYLAFLLLHTLASHRRVADILSNLILLPLCMIGGCFLPLEFFPPTLAALGRLTPNGAAITVLRQSLDPNAPLPWLAPFAAIALIALLFTLCAARLRRRFVF